MNLRGPLKSIDKHRFEDTVRQIEYEALKAVVTNTYPDLVSRITPFAPNCKTTDREDEYRKARIVQMLSRVIALGIDLTNIPDYSDCDALIQCICNLNS